MFIGLTIVIVIVGHPACRTIYAQALTLLRRLYRPGEGTVRSLRSQDGKGVF